MEIPNNVIGNSADEINNSNKRDDKEITLVMNRMFLTMRNLEILTIMIIKLTILIKSKMNKIVLVVNLLFLIIRNMELYILYTLKTKRIRANRIVFVDIAILHLCVILRASILAGPDIRRL